MERIQYRHQYKDMSAGSEPRPGTADRKSIAQQTITVS